MNTHIVRLLLCMPLALAALAQAQEPERLTYVKFGPCRAVETRAEAFETLSLSLTESRCAVPAAARVYVLTVSARPLAGRMQTVRVSTPGQPAEQVTVIASEGETTANTALVEAGPGGTVEVTASAPTDLQIDITGYFADPALSNLVFYPLPPCRVVDTRNVFRSASSSFGPPTLRAGETRRFLLPLSPECRVPRGAAAYALNVTMVPWGSAVSVVAKGEQPASGRVVTQQTILPAGETDGSIAITSSTVSDVLIEIHGYFAPNDGATGLFYRPLKPCEVSHTRSTSRQIPFGGPALDRQTARTIPMASAWHCEGITAQAKAYALQITALPEGQPLPFVTVYPAPVRPDPRGLERPDTATLHAFDGQPVTSFAIVPAGEGGAVNAFTLERTDLTIGLVGLFLR